MITEVPLLVILGKLVDQIPGPNQAQKRGRGRPKTYPDRLIVKALLVMVIRWSKSGYHGWWYGWKLHFACAITSFWLPLAAELTVANTYDAHVAPVLICQCVQRGKAMKFLRPRFIGKTGILLTIVLVSGTMWALAQAGSGTISTVAGTGGYSGSQPSPQRFAYFIKSYDQLNKGV